MSGSTLEFVWRSPVKGKTRGSTCDHVTQLSVIRSGVPSPVTHHYSPVTHRSALTSHSSCSSSPSVLVPTSPADLLEAITEETESADRKQHGLSKDEVLLLYPVSRVVIRASSSAPVQDDQPSPASHTPDPRRGLVQVLGPTSSGAADVVDLLTGSWC